MNMFTRHSLAYVVLAVAAAPLLCTTAARGATVRASADGPVSCQLSWTEFTANTNYPDTSATYWSVNFPIVRGGYLTVAGTFPHARYMSFNSYQGSVAYDDVEDDILVPDGGALNPFQPGNPRNGTVTYTVTVAFAPLQNPRATNTLYTGPATPPSNEVIYRVYVPDEGTDATGGVGLPRVRFNAPAGTATPPGCTSSDASARVSLRPAASVRRTTATATNPPTWSVGSEANQDYGNLDNAYITAVINLEFGQVLVIHAQAPTFPATYKGQPTFEGGTQLRYWSMCQNNLQTTGVISCTPDYLTSLSGGDYTIVVSQTKPTNAGASCEDTWLAWGSVTNGALILRNMLPAPSFSEAIQDVTPGQKKQDMGAYYPTSAYLATMSDFENLGCPPDLSGLPFG